MNACPNCQHMLNPYDYRGVHLTECSHCHGLWFDRDELRKAKDQTDDDLRWLDFDLFGDASNKFQTKTGKKECPRDSTILNSLTYADSKIIIEVCPKCQSVWLDADEFQKIIEYLEHIVISKPANEYTKATLKEFTEIFTGPENRISELKDFLSVAHLLNMRVAIENPWIITLSENIYRYFPIR